MTPRPQRERTRWDWKPIVVIPMMVYLNVGLQATGSSPGYVGLNNVNSPTLAVPAPINAAPQTEVDSLVANRGSVGASDRSQLLSAGVAPDSVHGIDGKGRHYLIERSPKWPMIEFRMRLKQPETIVDR